MLSGLFLFTNKRKTTLSTKIQAKILVPEIWILCLVLQILPTLLRKHNPCSKRVKKKIARLKAMTILLRA